MESLTSELSLRADAAAVQTISKTRQRWQCWVAISCWGYLMVSVALWLVTRLGADRWWLATVWLFGPRWVSLLPLVPLAIAALVIRRRSLWVLALTAWVLLFPVVGFCLPWRLALSGRGDGPRLRVVTCNIHGHGAKGRADSIGELIMSTNPDIVALQASGSRHDPAVFGTEQWYTLRDGELYLASRYPIRKVKELSVDAWPRPGTAVCYEVETPHGTVPFINLHLASPREEFEAVLNQSATAADRLRANSLTRLGQSRIVSEYAAGLGRATIVAGDFNTPGDCAVFRECWSKFADAFAVAGWGLGHSFLARRSSVRIDHILAGPAWQVRRCWISADIGSPHRPVIADLEWVDRPIGRKVETDESLR